MVATVKSSGIVHRRAVEVAIGHRHQAQRSHHGRFVSAGHLDFDIRRVMQHGFGVQRGHEYVVAIGIASLDAEADNVFVPALTAESVLKYPPHVEIQITRAYETAMMRALGLEPVPDGDFYGTPVHDATTFYRGRHLE